MTQLDIAVDADDELWTLDALPTPEAPYVEVESELVEVRSRFPSSYYTLTGETLPPRIRVRRGIAGTTKASHIQGSTLTPNYGLSGGGGGGAIAVTDGTTTVPDVTTLQTGVVTDEGGGVAASGTAVISPTDPGAIGAGNLWLDSAAATDSLYPLFVRDPTNAYWLQASLGDKLTTDGTPQTFFKIVDGDTNTIVQFRLSTSADSGIVASSAEGDPPEGRLDITPSSVRLGATADGIAFFGVKVWDNGIEVVGLPTADPVVAGFLWIDTAAGRVLKVSAG